MNSSIHSFTLALYFREKQKKEAAVEAFRMALAANRMDDAKSMINNFDPNAVSRYDGLEIV